MQLNKRQLAECLGIAEETVTQWMKQGCPVESQAKGSIGNVYTVGAVFAWRVARAERNDRPPGDVETERARLIKAQADKTELEVAELHGELVRVDDVTDAWSQHISAARAKLLSLPSKAAPRVMPGRIAETQELLRNIIDEALNELAGDGLPERARSRIARAAGVARTAEADRERVGRPRKGAQPGIKRRARKVADKPG